MVAQVDVIQLEKSVAPHKSGAPFNIPAISIAGPGRRFTLFQLVHSR